MSILNKHSISLLGQLVQCKEHTSVELNGSKLTIHLNPLYEPTEASWITINSDLFYELGIQEIYIPTMHRDCSGFFIFFDGNRRGLEDVFINNVSGGAVKVMDIEYLKGNVKLKEVVITTDHVFHLEGNDWGRWYDVLGGVNSLETYGNSGIYVYGGVKNDIENHIKECKEGYRNWLKNTRIKELPLLVDNKYLVKI